MNSQTLLDVAAFLTKQAEQLRMAERLGMANGETSAPDPAPFGRYASGEPKPAPAYDACKPLWEAAQRAGVFDIFKYVGPGVQEGAAQMYSGHVTDWRAVEDAIVELADEFGKVAIFCVTGNHGRSTHKIPSKQRAFTSFDWLVYAHLQSTFADDRRVQIMAPEGSDQLFRVYDTKFLLTHGDQFRGGDGMIGHIGPVMRGQKKKLSRNAEIGQEFDTMVIGHWHTYQPGDRIITNGSLIGYNEYADRSNFAFEYPRQAMWMVHPERGITYHIPVHVEEPKTAAQGSQWVAWLEAA